MVLRPRSTSGSSLTARIALDGGDEIKRELQDLGRVGEAAFRKLENAAKQLQTSSGFEASLIRIEKSLRRIGTQAETLGRTFQTIGRSLTTYVTVPLAALGVAAVRSFTKIDAAIADVGTLVDENIENLDEMREQFLDIGRRVPTSFEELASALYNIRSAGIDASDAMTVLERAAQLATAGLGTVQQAADIATSAINTWGLTGADAARVFDTLFITVAQGKTNIAELSQGFGAVASIVREAGVSVEEFFAATAALTTTGLPASQAFNQIRAAIVGLTRPSERLTAVLDKLGVESFSALIEREGSLVGAFNQIREAVGGTQAALIELVGRVEGVNAILGLTGQNAEAYADTLDKIAQGEGRLLDAFLARTEALDKRLEIFRNNITATLAEFGARLEPAIVAIVDSVTGLLIAFAELDEQTKDLIVQVTTFVAVVGPLFLVLGAGLRIVGFATKGFASLLGILRKFNSFLGLNFGVGLTKFLAAVVVRLGQIAGFVGFFVFLRNFIRYEEEAARATREHAAALAKVNEAVDAYVSGNEEALKTAAEELALRLQNAKAATDEALALRAKIEAMLRERANTPVGMMGGDDALFNAAVLAENNAAISQLRQQQEEIAAAAKEAADTIERMNTGLDETAQGAQQLSSSVRELSGEVRVFRGDTVQAFELSQEGVVQAQGKVEDLRKKVDETKEKTKEAGQELTNFEEHTRRLPQAVEEVSGANEELRQSSEEVGSAIDEATQKQLDSLRQTQEGAGKLAGELSVLESMFSEIDTQGFEKAGQAAEDVADEIDEVGEAAGDAASDVSSASSTMSSRLSSVIAVVDALTAAFNRAAAAARRLARARVSGPGGSVPGSGDVEGRATGGLFRGRPGTDTNLAWLSDKEYIIRPESVKKIGVAALDYINRLGKLPGFALGGLFDASGSPSRVGSLQGAGSGESMTVSFDLGDGVSIGPFSASPDVARSVVEAATRKAQLATTRKPLRRRG